jgi:hypothetical protein
MIYPYYNLLGGSLGDSLGGTCGTCPAYAPFCDPDLKQCTNVTCEDVKRYCYNDSTVGIRVRQFCPITCDCHNPYSAQVLQGADYGCPTTCSLKVPYEEALSNITCKDIEDLELMKDHIREVEKVVSEWPGQWQEQWSTTVADAFRAYGCSVIPFMNDNIFAPFDFCTFGGTLWPVKPMSYLCPITCGCDVEMIWGCPEQCDASTR